MDLQTAQKIVTTVLDLSDNNIEVRWSRQLLDISQCKGWQEWTRAKISEVYQFMNLPFTQKVNVVDLAMFVLEKQDPEFELSQHSHYIIHFHRQLVLLKQHCDHYLSANQQLQDRLNQTNFDYSHLLARFIEQDKLLIDLQSKHTQLEVAYSTLKEHLNRNS